MGRNGFMRRLMPLLVVPLITTLPLVGAAVAETRGLSFLVISSFYGDLPFARQVEQGLDDVLHYREGRNSLYFEYLDSSRLDLSQYDEKFAAMLADKYRGRRFDGVIVWGSAAAQFMDKHFDAVRPVRIVGAEVRPGLLRQMERPGVPVFGVRADEDYEAPLRLALAVGQVRKLALVGESHGGSGRQRMQAIRDGWARISPNAELIDLSDMPLDRVEAAVRAMTPGGAVYYTPVFHDERGGDIRPVDALRRLSAISPVPIFSQWETFLGTGAVGGYLLSPAAMARTAALLMEASIRDDSQQISELLKASPYVTAFDATLMAHWGIDEGRLPAGSRIVNQPSSLWADYRDYVVGALVIGIVLALVCIVLLLALVHRQRKLVRLALEGQALSQQVRMGMADLERKAGELARSNQELESFAYAVSHDLRTPLRAVRSYVQLLAQSAYDKLDEDEKEAMGFIREGAARLDGMVLGLLEYSRAGRPERQKFRTMDLKIEVGEALSTLNLGLMADDAVLTTDFAADLPPVIADSGSIDRLVQNLIENAVKYRAPDRPLTLHLSLTRQGDGVALAVSDNGVGIDPAQHGRIFGLFQRLVPGAEGDGYGIGLALCQRIMEVHGGSIRVESVPGRGSTFTAVFPAAAGRIA